MQCSCAGAVKKPGMTASKAAMEREAEEDMAGQLTGPATLNKEQRFLLYRINKLGSCIFYR